MVEEDLVDAGDTTGKHQGTKDEIRIIGGAKGLKRKTRGTDELGTIELVPGPSHKTLKEPIRIGARSNQCVKGNTIERVIN